MSKIFFYILLWAATYSLNAQSVHFGAESSLYIGQNATVFFGGQTSLSQIDNQGELFINSHLSSMTDSLGNVHFIGPENQSLVGTELIFNNLSVDKAGQLQLGAMALFIEDTLVLNRGIVITDESELVAKNHVTGGNDNAFIDGTFTLRVNDAETHIPLGIDGLYQPLFLEGFTENDLLEAGIFHPNDEPLLVADSLVGVSSSFLWTLENKSPDSEVNMIKTRSVFQQVDLENFDSPNPIRAFRYSPTMAMRQSEDSLFRTLGVASLLNTDSLTFGEITSMASMRLVSGKQYLLGLGLMPLSTGLRFYVPNAFAPKSKKSENSLFRPFLEGVTISSVSMTVWNEFNKPVFDQSVSNPDMKKFGWDGTQKNGSDAPQGVYFYQVVIDTPAKEFKKSGTVLLVR